MRCAPAALALYDTAAQLMLGVRQPRQMLKCANRSGRVRQQSRMHDMMCCRCAQPELRRRNWGVLGHRVGALGAMRGSEARRTECRRRHWGVTRHRVGARGVGRGWSKLVVITGASPEQRVGMRGAGRGGQCVRATIEEARCLTTRAADERQTSVHARRGVRGMPLTEGERPADIGARVRSRRSR